MKISARSSKAPRTKEPSRHARSCASCRRPIPFPVDALGTVLAPAARAIHDRVRAPLAICGQSVLAAATLAVQGHANIELPMGHAKPLSGYFVSVAATGERKSAVDQEALWPVRKREAGVARGLPPANVLNMRTPRPPGKRRVTRR